MTGMEIYALLQIAKMGTDAVGNIARGVRKKREAKDFESSEEFQPATEAGKKALSRMTDPDAYTASEAEVRKAGEERERGAVKPVEQALTDMVDAPSTTATTGRRDQLLAALSDIRQGSMTAGRGDVLSQKLAQESRDQGLFQIGRSFQDRLDALKGEGRESTAAGVSTLGAGALAGVGKLGYDRYKADRDESGPGTYGLPDDDPMGTDDLTSLTRPNLLSMPNQGRLVYGGKKP